MSTSQTSGTKNIDKTLGKIIDKNITQLVNVTSMVAVGSANKILIHKGENTDPNKVKAKIKDTIMNLEGILGYKTYKINDDLWHITMWNCEFNARAAMTEWIIIS